MPSSSTTASVRTGVAALRVNPLRTALSTLGVIIGVASLVAVLSLGDGMEAYARSQVSRTTSVQSVMISPITSDEVDGLRVERARWTRFEAADAADAARRVPGIVGAALVVSGTAPLRLGSSPRLRAARISALNAGAAALREDTLLAGRFFTPAEEATTVAVVSADLARELATRGDLRRALGAGFTVRGTELRVIGVAPPVPGRGGLAAWVPLGIAARVLDPRDLARPRTLTLKARRVEEVERVRRAAERWLARYPGGTQAFEVTTDRARADQMRQGFLLFKLFMGALTAISLLVGGIGIMNVLLASVTERTREIGIRKAVGARRRDIVLQFLAEAVAITGSGSLLGLALGVGTSFGVTALMRASLDAPIHAGLSLSTLLVAAASAVIVGVSFGTYPALRAARLSPIDAIRHE